MKHHLVPLLLAATTAVSHAQAPTRDQVVAAMKKAATFYRTKCASHGGYVYYYAPDFSWRLGEGKAAPDQIFVQPPGTPAVGLAYLKAYEATGDKFYLDAAREAAEALVYGQLASGGWMQTIDFAPKGGRVGKYRNGKGGDWNNSSFDDGISQAALRFIMHADRALKFQHREIHECSEFGRKTMLAAQFSHGAIPQTWTGPITTAAKATKGQFPDYDWHTEGRVKNYWDMPTLNDDVALYFSETMLDGWNIYKDERCRAALAKLGDFLILAQMPEPQPGWAQQYDLQMHPIWARKFEPAAMSGRETQTSIDILLRVHALTKDAKYLAPIPSALAWLKRSLLPDGRLARYYELQTNKPLYMTDDYKLTFDDSKVPQHYGWKNESRIADLEKALAAAKTGATILPKNDADVPKILRELDAEGRWVSTFSDQRLVGNPKFKPGQAYIASEVFCKNLEALSESIAKPQR